MKALLIKGNRADVVTTAADAWKELLDTTVTGTASLMIGGKSYQVIYNNCFADYGKLRPTVLTQDGEPLLYGPLLICRPEGPLTASDVIRIRERIITRESMIPGDTWKAIQL